MLLNFVITAALSIHSVSAVAYRKTTSKGKASIPCTQPYCQFPSSIDCPVNGGIHITQDALQNAVLNADRSGHPVDTSAADYASGLCASTAFHDIPYWAVRSLFAMLLSSRSLNANFQSVDKPSKLSWSIVLCVGIKWYFLLLCHHVWLREWLAKLLHRKQISVLVLSL